MDYQIPANLKALKGPKGDKGDPGRGLAYNGVLASTDDLPVVAAEVNEAYLIAGDLWAWDGSQWINAGPVQGPPGPEGPRGLQGSPFDPETLRPIVVDELSSTSSVVAAAVAAVDAEPRILSLMQGRAGDRHTVRTLSQFAIRESLTDCTWVTPDGTGVVVHPSVRFFPNGWNGYQWWAAATPYYASNNQIENPCVFVSENGTTWTTPPGVTNPLIIAPGGGGYNSDTHLVQGRDGELLLYYREYAGTSEKIRLFQSTDGATWIGPTTVWETVSTTSRIVSPAVWYDARSDQWVMLGVEIVTTPYVIKRMVADAPEGPFTYDQTVSVTPAWVASTGAWHIDAQPVGSQVIMVAQDGSGSGGDLYLAVSDDAGVSFTRSTKPIQVRKSYRSSLLPVITESGLAFEVWAGRSDTASWGVSRGLVTPRTGVSFETEMGMAEVKLYPYVVGDTFSRADNPTTLGTAPSGQSWTGSWQVVSGRATTTSGAQTVTLNSGIADHEVSATINRNGATTGEAYLIARYVDAGNYIRVGYGSTNLNIQTVVAFAATTVETRAPFDSANPHRVTIRCVGSTITVLIDDSVWRTFTHSTGSTATTVGMRFSVTTSTADDFAVRRAV